MKDNQKKIFDAIDWNDIYYGYSCKCGFDFIMRDNDEDNYIVNGIEYPIVFNEGSCFDSLNWNELHRCPECLEFATFSDGT